MTDPQNESKITATGKTEKVKDPKRVAAGKRLAAISKAAKEKKMLERLETEKQLEQSDTNFLAYGLAIAGLFACCAGAYHREKIYVFFKKEPKEEEDTPQTEHVAPKENKLQTFD